MLPLQWECITTWDLMLNFCLIWLVWGWIWQWSLVSSNRYQCWIIRNEARMCQNEVDGKNHSVSWRPRYNLISKCIPMPCPGDLCKSIWRSVWLWPKNGAILPAPSMNLVALDCRALFFSSSCWHATMAICGFHISYLIIFIFITSSHAHY